jgi:ribosomal protein L14
VQSAKILHVRNTGRQRPSVIDTATIVPRKYKLIKKYLKKRGRLVGLFIATRRWAERAAGGIFVRFEFLKLVLIDEQEKFLGSRVYGRVCKELVTNEKTVVSFKRIILASNGYI